MPTDETAEAILGAFVEIATWSAKTRHYANEVGECHPGHRYGDSLCSTEGNPVRGMNQATLAAECASFGRALAVITSLPLCKKCERKATLRAEVSE